MSKRYLFLSVILLGVVESVFAQTPPPCPICPPDEQIPIDGVPLFVALIIATASGLFLLSKFNRKTTK